VLSLKSLRKSLLVPSIADQMPRWEVNKLGRRLQMTPKQGELDLERVRDSIYFFN